MTSATMDTVCPCLVAIEGNIGVGKSTVIKQLAVLFKDDERVVVLPEPVEEWLAKGFLSGMYDGTISKGEFQLMVLQSLTGVLQRAMLRNPPPAIIITERSPLSNYHVFAKANLSGRSLDLYHHSWEYACAGFPRGLHPHIIYLKAPVDTLLERMIMRGRLEECLVSAEYLTTLEKNHEYWLKNASCMTVDATRSCAEVWQSTCTALHIVLSDALKQTQTQSVITRFLTISTAVPLSDGCE